MSEIIAEGEGGEWSVQQHFHLIGHGLTARKGRCGWKPTARHGDGVRSAQDARLLTNGGYGPSCLGRAHFTPVNEALTRHSLRASASS